MGTTTVTKHDCESCVSLTARLQQVEDELKVTDSLLADRQMVLDMRRTP